MRYFELILGAFCILYAIIKTPRAIIKHDYKTIRFIIVAMMLQNLVCVFVYKFVPNIVSQAIILYKELIMYGTVVVCWVFEKKGKLQSSLVPWMIEIMLLGIFMLVGNATVYTKLICFRQLMTPVILILFGSCIYIERNRLSKIVKFIVNIGLLQAIFGLIEEFILGDIFWKAIHVENLLYAKGTEQWIYYNGLPGDFYTADFYSFIGMAVRRLVGIAVDPLLTAHYLAFCIIILLFVPVFSSKKKQNVILAIITIATILTLSKGAIMIIGIGYWYKLWRTKKIYAIITFFPMIGIVIYIICSGVFYTVSRHVGGLTSSLTISSILGGGLGTAGNYAYLYGQSSNTGESYIGLIMGQTGVIGLVTFIYSYVVCARSAIRTNPLKLTYAVFAYVIAVLIESTFSESAINFVGSGIGFIMLGMLQNRISYKEKLSDVDL